MDQIIEQVNPKNREWVESLSPEDIAHLLDSLAMVPDVVTNIGVSKTYKYLLEQETTSAPEYSQVAAVKGLQGESEFADMCEEHLPKCFKVRNKAKVAKSGDFLIEWTSPETNKVYTYLVDVKNYKCTVPTKEVEKFYRDIKLHQSLSGAIMISLHSKIVGKKKTFTFEERMFGTNCVPVSYVCTNEPLILSHVIKFMCELVELREKKKLTFSCSEKIMSLFNQLSQQLDTFSKSRGVLMETKSVIEKQFMRIFSEMLSVEHVFKTGLQDLQREIVAETDENGNPKVMQTSFGGIKIMAPAKGKKYFTFIKDYTCGHSEIGYDTSVVVYMDTEDEFYMCDGICEACQEKEKFGDEYKYGLDGSDQSDKRPKQMPRPKTNILDDIEKSIPNFSKSNDTMNRMLENIWESGDWDVGKFIKSKNTWVLTNHSLATLKIRFLKKSTKYELNLLNDIFPGTFDEEGYANICKQLDIAI